MTVEEGRGCLAGEDGAKDRFPVGMRVLAVDDDLGCLKVLEALLRKCQYHVTTTNQAVKALNMLRENMNKFDLVISDVQMPDMDGFKLLELVGLEMDLPVIMLSAYGDTKFVMKGIAHGACDYLLKPVRIEELQNIWQHVIRRKNQNKCLNQEKGHHSAGEGGQGPASAGNADQNGKHNRKRKDQDEDEEEEGKENAQENDDPSSQKKPRVVWSVDLHKKFVAAVNQLGVDKAFPKRILDLMNVEGLTRENVASHLQKYRLYLKRISSAASQQANLVAALGGKDTSYLRVTSLNGFGDFRALAGPGRLSNTALPSYPHGGMLGRLNTASGMNLHGLTSPGMIQSSHTQNSSNSMNTLAKLQPVTLSADQNGSIFPGVSATLEIDQLQQSKCIPHIRDFNPIDDPAVFTVANGISGTRMTVSSSSNSLPSVPNNPLLLHGNPQQTLSRVEFVNQASPKGASLKQEPHEIGTYGSNFLDHGSINENWQSAVQLPKFQSNPLPLSEQFNNISTPFGNSRGDMQCQAGLLDNVVQNVNLAPAQRWEECRKDYTFHSDHTFSTLNSLVPASGVVGSLSQSLDQKDAASNRKMDMSLSGQLNSGALPPMQQSEIDKLAMDPKIRSNEDYLLEQRKSQDDFLRNRCESLEDLMAAMIKREQGETILMDGEFGIDAYSLGSCI
ncbi:two-component response regulator ARR12-like isoform X2 [Malania oleifera]|uniref:two-component response regulator ARR12-like isoform X2 n=1 Tax=Malania oleifera TaxID=397392 RepID=UPI0025AEA74B|nr:two-component response regulator ARR12-like isoform X2 [Malania oleifera]